MVAQLLRAGARPEVVVVGDDVDPEPYAAAASVLVADRDVVDRLGDTDHGQGVLAVVARPEERDPAEPATVLVLDGLADPGNVGTVVRTAAALGVDAVVLTAGSADPWSPKAVRASAGALLAVTVCTGLGPAEVGGWCRARSLRLVVTDAGAGPPLDQIDPRPPTAWVVGSEAHGVSEPVRADADLAVHLPMTDAVESLNAAVVAGIVVARAARYRFPAGGGRR